MKKKFYSSVLAMLLSMTGTSAWAQTHISTADELRAIDANTSYVLDNDIDLEGNMGRVWWYSGTFDGNGHTIKNVNNFGLFSSTDNGAVIKNLTIESTDAKTVSTGFSPFVAYSRGKITFENCVNKLNIARSNARYVGGFIGEAHGANSEITFINCRNEGEIFVRSDQTGGFIGFDADNVNVTFEGCMNTGKIWSDEGGGIGGFIGEAKSGGTYTFRNCGNTGTIICQDSKGDKACAFIGSAAGTISLTNCWNSGVTMKWAYVDNEAQGWGTGTQANLPLTQNGTGTFTNCYDKYNDTPNGVTLITDEQVTSGELCFLLNGSVSGGTTFYQTLGTDSYPVCDNTHSQVYTKGTYQCDGVTPKTSGTTEYTNDPNEYIVDPHTIVDGICSVCGAIDPTLIVGGVYQIPNANVLKAFHNLTNVATANAKLTANIDMTSQGWTSLSNYAGTFDGGGFTITNLGAPLINTTASGATVKNLTLSGSLTTTQNHFGAFVNSSAGNLTIQNCVNETSITGNNSQIGGFLGYASGNNSNVTFTNCTNTGIITTKGSQTGGLLGFINASGASASFTNCLNTGDVSSTNWSVGGIAGQSNNAALSFVNCGNTGKITGTSENANAVEACPLVGNLYNSHPTATNCWNIGETQAVSSALPLISRNGGTCTNCYDKYNDTPSGVTLITDEQVTGGELCFLLNGSVSGGTTFYQNLGTNADAYPVTDSTHGKVYQKGTVRCDGLTPAEGATVEYLNTEASPTVQPHNYVEGICDFCGTFDMTFVTVTDGVYQIGTAAQLRWFSAALNATKIANSSNAVLTADIDLENVAFTPIGLFRDNNACSSGLPAVNIQYKGTFDGQGHIISNLTINDTQFHEAGLFSRLAWGSGAKVKNIGVKNVAITSSRTDGRIGAIVGFVGSNTSVENCFAFGEISMNVGGTQKGGVVGENNSGSVKNCWTTCEKVCLGDFTNSYAAVTAEQMASGELCYKINNGAGSNIFFQNIDNDQPADAYPVLSNTHGIVYKKGSYKCDRVTPSEGTVAEYSNSVSAVTIEDHSFVADNSQPVCTVCGVINETYEIALTDGFYQLGTANDLVWYSAYINQKSNTAKAAMTADIDMSTVANFTPIGLFRDGDVDGSGLPMVNIQYKGTFDGKGHVIKNLTINDTEYYETALFSRVPDDATIQNLGIENANISSVRSGMVAVLVGWMGQPTIKNVYTVGNFSLKANGNALAKKSLVAWGWSTGKTVNTWTVCDAIFNNKTSGNENSYAAVSEEDMASGELCYKLNQGAGETVYYETLGDGEDNYPVFDATHGKVSKMGTAGYSTFYKGTSASKFSSAVEVYTGEKKTKPTEHITLVQQDNTIPAATGVVLKAAAGSYYSVTDVASASPITGTNSLKGSDKAVTATGNEYVLAKKSKGVGFYPAAEGLVIPAGKAYVEDASGVKAFVFDFDDATGIEAIEHSPLTTDESIYNLAGQKMSKMQRGVNIIGGKKVMVK